MTHVPSLPATLEVRPWPDPVIDAVGHDLRSAYVERYWLPILGPSCTLLLRQLAERFDHEPEGFVLDVASCARSLGLGGGLGRQAPLGRAITRCSQFGATQRFGPAGVVVRRKLPTMARHQLARLPDALQAEHAHWVGGATLHVAGPPTGRGGPAGAPLSAVARRRAPATSPPTPGRPPGGWADD